MFIPKIKFRYAYPLDQERRILFKNKNFGDYPVKELVIEKVEEWQKIWNKFNEEIGQTCQASRQVK